MNLTALRLRLHLVVKRSGIITLLLRRKELAGELEIKGVFLERKCRTKERITNHTTYIFKYKETKVWSKYSEVEVQRKNK